MEKPLDPTTFQGSSEKYRGSPIHKVILNFFERINLLKIILNDRYKGILKTFFEEGNWETLSNYCDITKSSVVI